MFASFLRYHLPAILYAALIIGLSSLSNVQLPRVQFIEIDKVVHFCEYALFTLLIFRSMSHIHPRIGRVEASFFSLGLVAVFAFVDEFYQSFVPGRQSEWADYLTDVGAAAAVVAAIKLMGERLQRFIA